MGAPPSTLIGVRHALERRDRGRHRPGGQRPPRHGTGGIALCGTGVFGASLSHLTATPRLYGDPFQLSFSSNDGWSTPRFLDSLEHDRAVTGITEGVGRRSRSTRSPWGPSWERPSTAGSCSRRSVGHLPNGDGQVGLGVTTMRQVGAHVGSVVDVTVPRPSGEKRTVPFRVVSQVSFPVFGGGRQSLGTGAVFTDGRL